MPRFSILSILLAVTLIGVAISGFMGYQHSQSLALVTARLEMVEIRQQTYLRALQLLGRFDLEDAQDIEKHRRLLWMIEQIPPLADPADDLQLSPGFYFGTRTKLATVEIDSNEFELLAMTYNTNSIPGGVTTVLALFHNDRFVDYVMRDESTRLEADHEIQIADQDNDGKLDATIKIAQGMWLKCPQPVSYDISAEGLQLKTNQPNAE